MQIIKLLLNEIELFKPEGRRIYYNANISIIYFINFLHSHHFAMYVFI